MEITAREAARRIGERHLLSRDQARRVLAAGLAGPGRRTASALLFKEESVEALLARPMCDRDTLDELRPFIARLGRQRSLTLEQSWAQQAAVAGTGWRLPALTRVALRLPGQARHGRHPFIATLGGWVVLGAEITGWSIDPTQRAPRRSAPICSFDLTPPGRWYAAVAETWLPIENGAAWTLWGATTTTPSKLDSLSMDYHKQIQAAVLRALAEPPRSVLRASAARATRPPDRR